MKGARRVIGVAVVIVCMLAATASAGAARPVGTPIASRMALGPSIQVEKLKFAKHEGTVTLLAKVSGPGRLYLYGKNVVRRSVRSSGVGIAKLKVAAKGPARKRLRETGKVKLRIKLKFVTSEGGVAEKSRPVTLHLRR